MRTFVCAMAKSHRVPLSAVAGCVCLPLFIVLLQSPAHQRVTSLVLGILSWPLENLYSDAVMPAEFNVTDTTKYDHEDELVEVLTTRLTDYSSEVQNLHQDPCSGVQPADRECWDEQCNATFSSSPRERVRQVLKTRRLIPDQYLRAMSEASGVVGRHKHIFVTGASGNHYHEMQGLVRSLRHDVFPFLHDVILVIFDLGLTRFQRYVTEQNCNCTVLDFPFAQLPSFMRHLTCYSWKPVALSMLADKAEYLVWNDACIRWPRTSDPGRHLDDIFQRSHARGVQVIRDGGSLAVRTVESMVRFYGDQHCLYSPFPEILSGFELFSMDRFTREAILKPWLSCAFDRSCMCVGDFYWQFHCTDAPPRRLGRCHRFDQSSLGIIYSKLWAQHRPSIYIPSGSISVQREAQENWFQPRKGPVLMTLTGAVLALSAVGGWVGVVALGVCKGGGRVWVGQHLPSRKTALCWVAAECAALLWFLWLWL